MSQTLSLEEPSSLLPLPSAIPLPPPPEDLHSLSPAEPEHRVGPSPSQSQPLSQARSARGSRPYSTRKADWAPHLLREYEQYCNAPPGMRKLLWQEWTKEEQRQVYLVARALFREEQKRWTANEVEAADTCTLRRVNREFQRLQEEVSREQRSKIPTSPLMRTSTSAILPQHEVTHSWTNGKRIGEADNPGPPKPGLSGKGLFREFPSGQGYWSSQQLQKMVASIPTFWLQGRRKPGSKPLDRQSEISRTPPEKRVHQVSKPYSEDGAGPCQGSHHGQCKYSTERASRGPRYDGQTSLNPRTPPQLYARNQSRTADQPTFDYGQPLSYAAAVRGQQSPVSPPESLSRNRRRHPRRFRPFRITIDRYLGAAGS